MQCHMWTTERLGIVLRYLACKFQVKLVKVGKCPENVYVIRVLMNLTRLHRKWSLIWDSFLDLGFISDLVVHPMQVRAFTLVTWQFLQDFPSLPASLLCKCAKISSHTCTSNEIVFLRRAEYEKCGRMAGMVRWSSGGKAENVLLSHRWQLASVSMTGLLLLQLPLRLIIIINGRWLRRRRSHFIIVITLCHNFVLLQSSKPVPCVHGASTIFD